MKVQGQANGGCKLFDIRVNDVVYETKNYIMKRPGFSRTWPVYNF